MIRNLRQTSSPTPVGVMFAFLVLAAYPALAQTQNVTGQDAVYNSSGNPVASPSFIDASVTQQLNQTDLCATIYNIFKGTKGNPPYPTAGAVIDARGISGTTALTCPAGTTPWNNGTTTVSVPSNILLPATGGPSNSPPPNFTPIVISTGWVLPPNTHLFGQGDNPSSGTVIQASSGFSGTAMIQFGSSTCVATGCQAVSVEKLILDGQGRQSGGNYISGIVNQSSQLAYVDHVSLYQILGTGLTR